MVCTCCGLATCEQSVISCLELMLVSAALPPCLDNYRDRALRMPGLYSSSHSKATASPNIASFAQVWCPQMTRNTLQNSSLLNLMRNSMALGAPH